MSDSLYELPTELYQESITSSGYCDVQSILPHEGQYACHCTCGNWDIVVSDKEKGLALAREHTRPVTERELAKRAERAKAGQP